MAHCAFCIDAAVAVLCMALTFFTVTESREPDSPRSIDYAGSVLVALTLAPFILAVSKGGDWGWFSVATLACFAVAITPADGHRWSRPRRGAGCHRLPATRDSGLLEIPAL